MVWFIICSSTNCAHLCTSSTSWCGSFIHQHKLCTSLHIVHIMMQLIHSPAQTVHISAHRPHHDAAHSFTSTNCAHLCTSSTSWCSSFIHQHKLCTSLHIVHIMMQLIHSPAQTVHISAHRPHHDAAHSFTSTNCAHLCTSSTSWCSSFIHQHKLCTSLHIVHIMMQLIHSPAR